MRKQIQRLGYLFKVIQLIRGRVSMDERVIVECRFREIGKHLGLDGNGINWLSPCIWGQFGS